MAQDTVTDSTPPTELIGEGRRHLAVRDYNAAVESLAKACEVLAKEHGDTGDQCAEAYLWYGKALLGLSREESGVLGDGMPGANATKEDSQEEENGEVENDENEQETEKTEERMDIEKEAEQKEQKNSALDSTKENETVETNQNEAKRNIVDEVVTSNGEAEDETEVNLDNEDDIDNLQLAWEMLDLARSILRRRVDDGGGEAARTLLAETHLSLGEVALESETYDKAVIDMQSSLELQKELFSCNDRRIAETHYQIGLANSLASNFEEAITHFKNAANILQSRIKSLEDPSDEAAKKLVGNDLQHSAQDEIKELRELLPEIQEKIQDMMDYKAETIKRVRETLCPTNGAGSSFSSTNGAGPSSADPKPVTSNISHLIKRKRKSSETDCDATAPKRANT